VIADFFCSGGASKLLCSRKDSKGAAMSEFPEGKAKTASRGRGKFPSGNLSVTESFRLSIFKDPQSLFSVIADFFCSGGASQLLGLHKGRSATNKEHVICGGRERSISW
jgi:hypothetical protein